MPCFRAVISPPLCYWVFVAYLRREDPCPWVAPLVPSFAPWRIGVNSILLSMNFNEFVLLLHFFISHAQIDTETMNIMIHHIFSPYLVDRTAFGPERRRRRGSSCLLLYESICKSSGPFPPYVRVVRTSRTYTTGALAQLPRPSNDCHSTCLGYNQSRCRHTGGPPCPAPS